ncbi:hypothetical protein CARUB_v10027410mg [Capsella rubella]|uniref:Uncharacterized protein n=1 Tax=Capsella rubella TaxID=81985 RepID=R0EY85_9BRAS|nr:hypothetical protein CARUB_v10027410mg [Capsella rubella]
MCSLVEERLLTGSMEAFGGRVQALCPELSTLLRHRRRNNESMRRRRHMGSFHTSSGLSSSLDILNNRLPYIFSRFRSWLAWSFHALCFSGSLSFFFAPLFYIYCFLRLLS